MSALKGFKLGHAHDQSALTGCTIIMFDSDATAAADVRGSAPATSNFSTADPIHRSYRIDGIFFTGGSSFGLSAVRGAQEFFERNGRGLDVGFTTIPNIPAAAIFDLGVRKVETRPTAKLAEQACTAASADFPEQGSVGVGMGATVGKVCGIKQAMRGGFGASHARTIGGADVWVFAAVNAFGDVWSEGRSKILAGVRKSEESLEFADAGKLIEDGVVRIGFGSAAKVKHRGTSATSNTTLIALVTSASMDGITARKVASSCITGITDVVYPACTIFDGDLAIAASIGTVEEDLTHLCLVAQKQTSKAIINAVQHATAIPGFPTA